MREVVACVVWLVTGGVIITAMFQHVTMWISVPTVLGAVVGTAIALAPARRPESEPSIKAGVRDSGFHDL